MRALIVLAVGLVVASNASADGPPPKQADPCVSLTGAALGDCRICRKYEPGGGADAWAACQRRLAEERDEIPSLKSAIDGLDFQAMADADLDDFPEKARPTVERFWALQVDLAGLGKKAQDTRTTEGALADLAGAGTEVPDATTTAAVNDTLGRIRAKVAKEKACRADEKCIGPRRAEQQFFASVVLPMCTADQARQEAIAAMAHERANPSGYVNKVFLHDQGAIVQDAQDQIAAATPAYVKARHHAWKGWRSECTPPQ